jgi:hypothetical protein
MPAKDIIHQPVKNALIKDGWTITHDPYKIRYEDLSVFADLGAERPLAAERSGRKIVVEVKSFSGGSLVHDFEEALGQYILYRNLLKLTDPNRQLYLGISHLIYHRFFQRKAIQVIVQQCSLTLLTVKIDTEEVVKWID